MSEGRPQRVGDALAHARAALAPATDEGALEAQILLGRVLGQGRAWLVAHRDDELSPEQSTAFDALLARRCRGEPVAYILGRREFWSLDLAVTPQVLIPRPDTECLVERALQRLPADRMATVLDAGTGSGAVALALAVERPRLTVLASDLNASALVVASGNVARLAPGRVHLFRGNWVGAITTAGLDLIVSNPPYVAADDAHLLRGDVRFEPRDALVALREGLAAIDTLTRHAPRSLRPGGWLMVEHGAHQANAVQALFAAGGFIDVSTVKDLAGNDRITEGRRACRREPPPSGSSMRFPE